MAKKVLLVAVVAVVLVLALAPAAFAATPQDIYDDFKDNGTLDGTYTPEELKAYLNDPIIHQYGDPNVTEELDKIVTETLKPREGSREEFPFTGFDMLLMGGGAAILIGLGVWLRRSARKDKGEQGASS